MKLRNPSPLRYPGGKSALAGLLERIIYVNRVQGCTYVEPFAGGAGAAIKLLRGGHVDRIVINDSDPAIFSFWHSVMFNPDAFVDMLNSVPLTITEWRRQRIIYDHPLECPGLDLGFAAFFLNRCNRSGIIKGGGPIGGISQAGKWKLGARFNRQDLVNRVRELADFGDRIVILNEDATRLLSRLSTLFCNDVCFVYADPPYYVKGRELYLNHYTEDDHEKLAAVIKSQSEVMWVLTYDDVPTVRKLYRGMRVFPYKLRYSTHRSSQWGREIMIVPPQLDFPEGLYAN